MGGRTSRANNRPGDALPARLTSAAADLLQGFREHLAMGPMAYIK